MCTLHYTERNKSTGGGVVGGGQHQSFVETVNASERSKPVVGRFGVCVCLSPSWAEAPNQRKIIIIPTFLFDVSSSPGWTLYVIRSQYNSNFGQLLPEIIIQDQVLSPAPNPAYFIWRRRWQWAVAVMTKGHPYEIIISSSSQDQQRGQGERRIVRKKNELPVCLYLILVPNDWRNYHMQFDLVKGN